MARTEGALHDGGHGPEVEHTRIRLGVHLIDRRHEDIPTARLGQHSGVTLRRARVSLQVVRIVKLRRVDKDTGHTHVVLAHTATDKAQMPRMQCAHRGHQPDASASLSLLVQELAELPDSGYCIHSYADYMDKTVRLKRPQSNKIYHTYTPG